MTKCLECKTEFNVEEARDEYNSEFGEGISYDEYGEGLCGSCAASETQSNMNHGNAILMMNGDVDYDDDHVQKYL
ncbi:hypothetical protein OG241_41535 [Streptomyces sp. NBC_01390]|uniref:hypothetical protein n=1 Tax=Streptomyces sp. NBC_01390 TaxID=2903850 RepID=UPI0032553266